jgi:hypothetical protein
MALVEYLGAETSERGRQQDIARNPQMLSHHTFSFDRVYGPESTQTEVYETSARPQVHSVLQGYNATILAYG